MTRMEKLEYIKNFYPQLFALIAQKVPHAVENTAYMTDKDAVYCNAIIRSYCMRRNNPKLLDFLRL